jgi:hypothetical protein
MKQSLLWYKVGRDENPAFLHYSYACVAGFLAALIVSFNWNLN